MKATPPIDGTCTDGLSPESRPVVPVVGIGASAGGLEAFTQFLGHLDVNTGMAFVLVLHLDPKHDSLLTEILARMTSMPVIEVTNDTAIAANHVYVMPPNSRMTIVANRLKLDPRTSNDGHYPIDAFFSSLAVDCKEAAIGIVLSGNGSDGTEGLAVIASEGGVTIAQDPSSAKFDGMPTSAIARGVDFVRTPEKIAGELARLAKKWLMAGSNIENDGLNQIEDGSNHCGIIFALLRARRGMDLTKYKRPTVLRRIQRRMVHNRLNKIEAYVDLLRTNPSEIDSLYDDILIKVTHFFRNPESFSALKEQVIPALLRQRTLPKPVRIWVPGCATGEEAYSIAICILEFMAATGGSTKIEIFATDISEPALAKARLGQYDESIAEHVSSERLKRFFTNDGHGYRVAQEIRECCVFAKQNVARDPPFSNLDLISCRNVLIYLTPDVQKRIMSTFHFALNPDGFLILGSAETIGSDTDLFGILDRTNNFFTRKIAQHGAVVSNFELDGSQERLTANFQRFRV